ncbi:MAG: hypothetical protein H6865_07255 [Rhodospirillales bacterium]|nr:hypothetical protein [Alphaproteobacteria bacterium]MCB9987414.1 hypothetical protein [Rhodospirillales bacterium]USO07604.1 MAG: hypothetical protein H6866_09400 [Rhodospirillales bacterium]
MKWPLALFASTLVTACAIVFAALSPAVSQSRGAGFMMASGSAAYAWRVNTTTGAVSYCVRRSDSSDPTYILNNPPVCSGWTPPVQ